MNPSVDAHPVAAGWYLVQAAEPVPPGARLWLHGVDTDPDTGARAVRIPVRSAGICMEGTVALLTRETVDLRLAEQEDGPAIGFSLTPINRRSALRRMIAPLWRDRSGHGRRALTAVGGRFLAGLAARDFSRAVWRLSATYAGLHVRSEPCRLHVGMLPRIVDLEPIDQLRPVPGTTGAHHWEATGHDPKFRLSMDGLPVALPAGWYVLDAVMRREEGQLLAPCLYPDYGSLARQDDMIPLPAPGSDGVVSSLVLLKHPVKALRLDPSVRPVRFEARGFALRRVARWRALSMMAVVRDAQARVDMRATLLRAQDFLRQARREGVSAATRTLFAAYTRRRLAASDGYADWVRRYDSIDEQMRAQFRRRAAALGDGPTISILLPVYDTPERWLVRCLESVIAQAYPRWELCVADDASPSAHVRRVLERFAASDPRIRVSFRSRNGHICAASNTALEMATGQFVALLDHDDELRPHALLEIAEAVSARPDLQLLYSDEDKVDEEGRRLEPYFKPDWDSDLLLGQNYLCHLTVVSRRLVEAVGGFREGFEGSQDHDLVLRCSRRLPASGIAHVPRVLYHWRAIPGSTALHRDAKDYAALAGARAVAEHVQRIAPQAGVEILEQGHYRVRWPLPEPRPLVSIVIPTRDRAELLRKCVESVLHVTTYEPLELLIVDNGSVEPDALEYLEEIQSDARVRVLRYRAPFNYAAINNWAITQARGSVIALLNNDIEVLSPDWLEEMVAQAMRPDIGAVGALLYYPDGRIQHAGVVLGVGGIANHAYAGEPAGIPGHGGRARVVQTMSAVTGACLVVRRALYEAVGGMDERLQVAFNDVDFCLRLREAGYRNLWTPFARLYHHESASRGEDVEGERRERFLGEIALMEARWGHCLESDPAYNPNLSLEGRAFDLADPPRS